MKLQDITSLHKPPEPLELYLSLEDILFHRDCVLASSGCFEDQYLKIASKINLLFIGSQFSNIDTVTPFELLTNISVI